MWSLGNMAGSVLVGSGLAASVNLIVVMSCVRLCASAMRWTITGSYHKTLGIRQGTSNEWQVFPWNQEDRRQVLYTVSDSPECGVRLVIQWRAWTAVYSRSARFREIEELACSSAVPGGQPGTAIADALRWTARCIAIAGRYCDAESWGFSVLQQFEKMVDCASNSQHMWPLVGVSSYIDVLMQNSDRILPHFE